MSKRLSSLLLTSWMLLGQSDGPTPIFQSGTRYVEVDATVRHKRVRPEGTAELMKWLLDSGPPFGPPGRPFDGLNKNDFTLLDNGKQQQIAVFEVGAAVRGTAWTPPIGGIMNRINMDSVARGATVVLVDLLNTPFDLTDYARLGLKRLLSSLEPGFANYALYSLGSKLHVLHDFGDDRRKLLDAGLRIKVGDGAFPSDYQSALDDFGDVMGEPGGPVIAAREFHVQLTLRALHNISEHLAGVSGRKNLVWLSQSPPLLPQVTSLLERAGIALYPVKVRGAGSIPGTPVSLTGFAKLATSGGRAFFDAKDLSFAVQTAEEDLQTRYVLGFYPPEKSLDGKVHDITLRINKARTDVDELHYRTTYVASKAAPRLVDPGAEPSMLQLLDSPLISSGIGIVVRAARNTENPALFRVLVTVDLHDLSMHYENGRFAGSIEFALPDPASRLSAKTGQVSLAIPEDQYVAALENGHTFAIAGIDLPNGNLHLVVRDRSTGKTGSIRAQIQ